MDTLALGTFPRALDLIVLVLLHEVSARLGPEGDRPGRVGRRFFDPRQQEIVDVEYHEGFEALFGPVRPAMVPVVDRSPESLLGYYHDMLTNHMLAGQFQLGIDRRFPDYERLVLSPRNLLACLWWQFARESNHSV